MPDYELALLLKDCILFLYDVFSVRSSSILVNVYSEAFNSFGKFIPDFTHSAKGC